jgi:hypothetical protein
MIMSIEVRRSYRWLVAAALVGFSFTLPALISEAQNKRLYTFLSKTHSGCNATSSGQTYYAHTSGVTSGWVDTCNVQASGSTATTVCPNTTTYHNTVVGRLQGNGGLVVIGAWSPWTTWTNTAQSGSVVADTTASCPAGNSVQAYSWGQNI